MPKVSIAIPTCDRKEYLVDTINSILAQTMNDFELIIFDNCSKYDIRGLISSFNDDRISLSINDKNIGGQKNFVNVFRYSYRSPYLMVLHDDDTLNPCALELQVKIFEDNDNLVWIGGRMMFVADFQKMLSFTSLVQSYRIVDVSELSRILMRGFHLGFSSIMYRVDSIIDCEPLQKTFFKWWDMPFLKEIAKKGKVAVIDSAISNNRVHGGQDSRADSISKIDNIINLYLYNRSCLPEPLTKSDKKLFEKYSTNYMILTGLGFSKNFKEYYQFLLRVNKLGLFEWSHLNWRGMYYSLLVVRGLINKRITK